MSDRSSCSVGPDVLSAFMDEELPEERMKELREHVRTCDRCDDRLSRLRETQRVARTVDPPSAPDSFVSDVRERIEQEPTDGQSETDRSPNRTNSTPKASGDTTETTDQDDGFRGHSMGLAAAAVLLVGISVGLLLMVQETRRKQMQQVAKESGSNRETTPTNADSSDMKTEREEAKAPSSSKFSNEGASEDRSEEKSSKKATGSRANVDNDHVESGNQNNKAEIASADRNDAQSGENRKREDRSGGLHRAQDKRKLSPLLTRLRGPRDAVLTDVVSALSTLHPDQAKLRAWIPADAQEEAKASEKALVSSSSSTDEEAGQAWKEVRTLSLDVSTEQMSELLQQNATLELSIPQDEARLFIGALVQQGHSPAVLTSEPEEIGGTSQFASNALRDRARAGRKSAQEEGEKEASTNTDRRASELRRSLVALQQSNLRLQECRTEWSKNASDDSGTAATGTAISLPTLRRFLQKYKKKTDQQSEFDRTEANAAASGTSGQKSLSGERANKRRRVLQDWVTFLENRPSSWSASEDTGTEPDHKARLNELKEQNQKQNPKKSKEQLSRFLDVHLHLQLNDLSSPNPESQSKPQQQAEQK